MEKTTTDVRRGRVPDIVLQRKDWIGFLARFTRDNRGAHARLEILGPDVGRQIETEDRPFDGIGADVKDGEDAIWIHFGSTLEDHLTHGIQGVTGLWVRPPVGNFGAAVLVQAGDGARTLLELSRPQDYALPPAEPR
jgi:hypothetical protein